MSNFSNEPGDTARKSETEKGASRLWGGRFEQAASDIAIEISESISFDRYLFEHDITGSQAHARMLKKTGVLKGETADKIIAGLDTIRSEIRENKMNFDPRLEDIHTHIEKRLIELIGEEGKALHTGRSRNDQVAVDTHLFLKEHMLDQKGRLLELLQSLLEAAQKNKDKIWAGYTHTQIGQPVLLSHYLMAYFWKFRRDFELLNFALGETDCSPLGSAAMAGPNYPVDKEFTASELGFASVYRNSLDGVSNRDYQLSYHFFASRLFLHISRFCEDMILYNTTEFSYVTMSDKVTTGSSIMPQKKNPDIAELLRGKTGRVIGNFTALMVNLKGLPMTYNRDLQEDKIYLFDTVRQVTLGLGGMVEMVNQTRFHSGKVEQNLKKGFAQATDIADYLVSNYGAPFREAHELTGALILYCEKNRLFLDQLKQEDIAEVWGGAYELPADVLDMKKGIDRKQGTGSTAARRVAEQMETAAKELQQLKKT